jgi:hypothetical protein
MGEQTAPKSRKRLYSLIAATLAICLILSVFLMLNQNSNLPAAETQDTQPQATTQPSQTPEGIVHGDTITNENASQVPVQNVTYPLNEGGAIILAIPYITNYAAEHNRNIISINATFDPKAVILDGPRGPSLNDLKTPNLNWSSYPAWYVHGTFERINDTDNAEHYITGFTVCLYVDNGELGSAGPDGFFRDAY